MSSEKIDELKAVVRSFFAKNYSQPSHFDTKTAADRSFRYQNLLELYIFLVEFREARLFKDVSDILAVMERHAIQDRRYIETGEVILRYEDS